MQQAYDSIPIDDRHTSELLDIAVRHARTLHVRCSDSTEEELRLLKERLHHHRKPSDVGESELVVAILLGIPQAIEAGVRLPAKCIGLAARPLSDGDHFRTALLEFAEMSLRLHEALAGDGSAEVAQKNQHEWRVFPKIGKRLVLIVPTLQHEIRCDCSYRSRHEKSPSHPLRAGYRVRNTEFRLYSICHATQAHEAHAACWFL